MVEDLGEQIGACRPGQRVSILDEALSKLAGRRPAS